MNTFRACFFDGQWIVDLAFQISDCGASNHWAVDKIDGNRVEGGQ